MVINFRLGGESCLSLFLYKIKTTTDDIIKIVYISYYSENDFYIFNKNSIQTVKLEEVEIIKIAAIKLYPFFNLNIRTCHLESV